MCPPTKPLSPSVLRAMIEWIGDSRGRRPWHPLASPSFLRRVTIRSKTIVRRSDGQLILVELLESGEGPGGARH